MGMHMHLPPHSPKGFPSGSRPDNKQTVATFQEPGHMPVQASGQPRKQPSQPHPLDMAKVFKRSRHRPPASPGGAGQYSSIMAKCTILPASRARSPCVTPAPEFLFRSSCISQVPSMWLLASRHLVPLYPSCLQWSSELSSLPWASWGAPECPPVWGLPL